MNPPPETAAIVPNPTGRTHLKDGKSIREVPVSVTRGGAKRPAVSVVLVGVLVRPSPRDDLCDRFSGTKSRWKPAFQAGTGPIAGRFESAAGNEP